MAQEKVQQSSVTTPADGKSLGPSLDLDASIRRYIKSEIRRALPRAVEEATRQLDHDAEVAGMVRLIAARSGDAKDEVLRKALTLYGLAIDARERGNRLAVVDPDDYIVHDVIGFDPVGQVLATRES